MSKENLKVVSDVSQPKSTPRPTSFSPTFVSAFKMCIHNSRKYIDRGHIIKGRDYTLGCSLKSRFARREIEIAKDSLLPYEY